MRLTCLKCGHQIELASAAGVRVACACGRDYTDPGVKNTGTQPSERAAERSRYKAFRAAGVVKNFGGFAFGIALLGVLFFPLGLVGAGIGIYTLTMIRGPLGRYSGRRHAMFAVAFGASIFLVEGAFAMRWLETRRKQAMAAKQAGAAEDLKRLLRAQRLYRATAEVYGSFDRFRFQPAFNEYTIYLGRSEVDVHPAERDGEEIIDPLPDGFFPGVGSDTFTAVAVGNIDGDPDLDVWVLTQEGTPIHAANDAIDPGDVLPPSTGPPQGATDSGPDRTGETPTDIDSEGSNEDIESPQDAPAPGPAPVAKPPVAAPAPAPQAKPAPTPAAQPADAAVPGAGAEAEASEPEPEDDGIPVPEPVPDDEM